MNNIWKNYTRTTKWVNLIGLDNKTIQPKDIN